MRDAVFRKTFSRHADGSGHYGKRGTASGDAKRVGKAFLWKGMGAFRHKVMGVCPAFAVVAGRGKYRREKGAVRRYDGFL